MTLTALMLFPLQENWRNETMMGYGMWVASVIAISLATAGCNGTFVKKDPCTYENGHQQSVHFHENDKDVDPNAKGCIDFARGWQAAMTPEAIEARRQDRINAEAKRQEERDSIRTVLDK